MAAGLYMSFIRTSSIAGLCEPLNSENVATSFIPESPEKANETNLPNTKVGSTFTKKKILN